MGFELDLALKIGTSVLMWEAHNGFAYLCAALVCFAFAPIVGRPAVVGGCAFASMFVLFVVDMAAVVVWAYTVASEPDLAALVSALRLVFGLLTVLPVIAVVIATYLDRPVVEAAEPGLEVA